MCVLSCIQLSTAPWIVAHQAPLPTEISQARIMQWVPFPTLGDLPAPGIKPSSSAWQRDSLSRASPGKPIGGSKMESHPWVHVDKSEAYKMLPLTFIFLTY